MKLALPLLLRSALLAAMAVVGTTLSSAVLAGGSLALVVASQASAASVNLEADSSYDSLYAPDGVMANGYTLTLKGDSQISVIDTGTGDHATGSSNLVVSGGTTEVTVSDKWVNLKNLSLSSESRATFGASVSVAGNISSVDAVGTLTSGTNAGLEAEWCVYVGTKDGDSVAAGTGDVNLAGNLVARQGYIEILGDATVTKVDGTLGNMSAGRWVTIGGEVSVAGNLTAGEGVTIGGVANVAGTLSTKTGNISLAQGGTVGTLSAAGTVTIGGDASITSVAQAEGATQGTSLAITGGHTDLYGGSGLHDVSLSGTGSLTVHKYTEANSFTNTGSGTLHVIEAFMAGNDLYVGNYRLGWDTTIDTLVNSGTLDVSNRTLIINNGTEQGGHLVTDILEVGGDSSFSSLQAYKELRTHGNTVTLAGDSSIASVTAVSGATQATSLTITGGHTDLYGGSLQGLSIANGATLTLHEYMEAASFTNSGDGTLTVSKAFKAGNDLYIGEGYTHTLWAETTLDTLVSTGKLIMGDPTNSARSHLLTINNEVLQGGVVEGHNVNLGADGTFTGLKIHGYLYGNANTVTLTGDSAINNFALSEGAAQGISLVVTGGHTTLQKGTLQGITLSGTGSMSVDNELTVEDSVSIGGGSTLTVNDYMVVKGSLEQAEGSELIVNSGLRVGETLYVGAQGLTLTEETTLDTLVSTGKLTMGDPTNSARSHLLTINNEVLQGGVVEGHNVNLGADGTFTGLKIHGYLYGNANTVTLTGDSAINNFALSEGAAQGISLVVTGGHTTLQKGTLQGITLSGTGSMSVDNELTVEDSVSIGGGSTLTVNDYMVVKGSLEQAEGSELIVNSGLRVGDSSDGGTLYVGNLALAQNTRVDRLVNTGTLELQKDGTRHSLWIYEGTEQGGRVLASRVTVGGDSSFTSLDADGGLHTQGNKVTLAADSVISYITTEAADGTASSLALTGGTTTVKSATVLETLDVAEGAALTVNGDLSVGGALNAGSTGTEATDGTVTVGGAFALAGSASNVALSAASATIASADGSELALENVDLAVNGGVVELGNVRLTGDSCIHSTASTAGVLTFERLTLVLQKDINSALAPQAATLSLGDESLVEGLADSYTFGIQSDLLENVTLAEGGEMVVDLSYWGEEIGRSGLSNVSLTFSPDVDLTALPGVQVTFDGEHFAEASMVEGNIATFDIRNLPIPEPGTATLSLLALTALAARRRRK